MNAESVFQDAFSSNLFRIGKNVLLFKTAEYRITEGSSIRVLRCILVHEQTVVIDTETKTDDTLSFIDIINDNQVLLRLYV